jgi:hypothetical protein
MNDPQVLKTKAGNMCSILPLICSCTLSVPNIRNTFLILSCTPFCHQNSLNLSWHGLYKVFKAFHRDAGPCWLQCFPRLCQVGWMSFGWWTILDTHRETVEHGKPNRVAVLDTLKTVRLPPTTIPRSKTLKSFVMPIHPLNGTHIQSMSQLSGRNVQ